MLIFHHIPSKFGFCFGHTCSSSSIEPMMSMQAPTNTDAAPLFSDINEIPNMKPDDPIPPIPRAYRMDTSSWKKKTKKKTMKLNELSSLNALYAGLNQQTNESGM